MANEFHLEKLTENVKSWNQWREANPDVIPDLRYAEFTLGQKQFGLINGGPVNLNSALLFKADLKHATLVEADLSDAELVEADLASASLNFADLRRANLTDAILTGADLSGVKLDEAVIIGADLSAARNLTQEQLEVAVGDAATLLPGGLVAPETWRMVTYQSGDDFGENWDAGDHADLFISADEDVDLYAVLGVSRGETTQNIRAVYRVKAKAAHPDLNPDHPGAVKEFHRLTQAYAILRDAKRRKRYDKGEIGPDGEETAAYLYAQRHAALVRQLWRYAAIGLVATVLVGAGITVMLAHLLQQAGKTPVASQPGIERPAEIAKESGTLSQPAPALPAPEPEQAVAEPPPVAQSQTADAPPAPAHEETPPPASDAAASPPAAQEPPAQNAAAEPEPRAETATASTPEPKSDEPAAGAPEVPAPPPAAAQAATPEPEKAAEPEDDTPRALPEPVPAASPGNSSETGTKPGEQHAARQPETQPQSPAPEKKAAAPENAGEPRNFVCPPNAAAVKKLPRSQRALIASKCPPKAAPDAAPSAAAQSDTPAPKADHAETPAPAQSEPPKPAQPQPGANSVSDIMTGGI